MKTEKPGTAEKLDTNPGPANLGENPENGVNAYDFLMSKQTTGEMVPGLFDILHTPVLVANKAHHFNDDAYAAQDANA